MTRHEVISKVTSHLITLIGAICLALLLVFASATDEADDAAARAQVMWDQLSEFIENLPMEK